MTVQHPDIPTSLEDFRRALEWASGVEVFWMNQSLEGRNREACERWVEMHPVNIRKIGTDEVRYIDTGAAAPDFPLKEAVSGNRVINMDLKFWSRSQVPANSAWWLASQTQNKIQHPHIRRTWLTGACLGINTVGDILDDVAGSEFDDRVEDVAVMEVSLNAVITSIEDAILVSCIEEIKATTGFKNIDGSNLDSSLQLNDEVIP